MLKFDEFQGFYLLGCLNLYIPMFKYFYFFMELLKVSKSQKENTKFCTVEASKELGKHFVRFVDDWRAWCFSVEIYRSLERPWTSFLS